MEVDDDPSPMKNLTKRGPDESASDLDFRSGAESDGDVDEDSEAEMFDPRELELYRNQNGRTARVTPTKGTRRKQVTPNKATSMIQKTGNTAKTITLQHAKAGETRNTRPSQQRLAAHPMAPSNATNRHMHLSKQMLPAKAMVSSIATDQQVASQMKAVDSVRTARTDAIYIPQTVPLKAEAAARIYSAPSQNQSGVDGNNSHKPIVGSGSGPIDRAVPINSNSMLNSTTISAAQANNTLSSQTPFGPIPNNFLTTMTRPHTSMVTQAHNSELDTEPRLGLKLRFKIPQEKPQTPIPMKPESRPVHLTQFKAKPDISVMITPK